MSLIKIVNENDELRFDTSNIADGAGDICIILKAKAGRQAVLEIDAHRSIAITVLTPDKIWMGMPK